MKIAVGYIFAVMLIIVGILSMQGQAQAAPFNSNNPNIVANYPTGDHGIVGESALHQGADLVMRAGNNGVFQQWFYGTSFEASPAITEGDHSVWKPAKNGSCPATWILVPDANPSWGDYLKPGDYCVHTNDFKVKN